MKEEKYRKMFSEMFKGEKNPVYKMPEQKRKELSPFSKDFYKKRNLSETDYADFLKYALKDREFDTTLKYYLKRGYSEEKAKQKLKERQTTFSLKKCIEKYGDAEGLKKWKDRQEKWKKKVFNDKTYIGGGRSMLAENIIQEILLNSPSTKEYLYGKNEKFIRGKGDFGARKYDLTHINNKKIIEINGIFWHCKPGLYDENFYNTPRRMYAKDIWKYDEEKNKLANSYGYSVLTIWEDEYLKNPSNAVKKCMDFIYEKNT
jgi:G:T-mismatch repair DNA endonuclease (very short patch repair protein)